MQRRLELLRSGYMGIIFIFIAGKNKSAMKKSKMWPGQKQLHYKVNTSAQTTCNNNTKLTKSLE